MGVWLMLLKPRLPSCLPAEGHMWAKAGSVLSCLVSAICSISEGVLGQKLQGVLDLRQSKKSTEILFDRPSKRLTHEWDPKGSHTAHAGPESQKLTVFFSEEAAWWSTGKMSSTGKQAAGWA